MSDNPRDEAVRTTLRAMRVAVECADLAMELRSSNAPPEILEPAVDVATKMLMSAVRCAVILDAAMEQVARAEASVPPAQLN